MKILPALKLITDAASEPVTTDEAKDHVRADHDDDDTLIGTLITAARQQAELYTGRSFINTTWDYSLPEWFDVARLPRSPLSSVTSVKYYDANNTQQTLSSSYYLVGTNGDPGIVSLADGYTWPTLYYRPHPITIRFVAGYGATAAYVPQAIKQAILLMVGDLYANRESIVVGTVSSRIALTAQALLGPYRVIEAA